MSCLPSCIFCSSLVHGHQTVAIHPPLLASTQIIIPSPAPISPCRYVIDPEFGFYGPMAFDVAKILANLILTVFATYGLEATEPHKPRAEQRRTPAVGSATVAGRCPTSIQRSWVRSSVRSPSEATLIGSYASARAVGEPRGRA